MVAKKRKGIRKQGLRRGEQGVNPLLIALGAGAGAAGGAGMGARRAMQTEKRIPAAASRMVNRSLKDFNRLEMGANLDYQRSNEANRIRFADEGVSRETRRFQAGQAERYAQDARFGQRKASDIKSSGMLDLSVRKDTIRNKLAAAPKVASRRTKRMAVKGAIKGGVLAALAQAVLAEMNKKKRD